METNLISGAVLFESTECIRTLFADGRVDPADSDNQALCWAAKFDHMESVKALLEDPRVDPNAALKVKCRPEIHSLIERIETCIIGDLESLKAKELATLPEWELDILISRNREHKEVLRHLFKIRLERLGIYKTVEEHSLHEFLVNLAISGGFWRPGQLGALVDYVAFLQVKGELPNELVGRIAALTCYLVAQGD